MTNLFIPGASADQMAWFDEVQRLSAEHAARAREAKYGLDVTDLAPSIAAPTLVLHARDDALVPFEEGRLTATLIPGAQFVPLDSANHILLADEPAFSAFTAELRGFLDPTPAAEDGCGDALPGMTTRELQILELVAQGLGNDDLAAALCISSRTVERHLSNAYRKLGVSGNAARAAAAARYSRQRLPSGS